MQWAVRGHPQERGKGALLVEAVAGVGGQGVLEQREQGEDPLATQSGRENELSQTNRGVGGVCVGPVLSVQ